MWTQTVAILAFATWIYLMLARGGFWLARERDDGAEPAPPAWPRLTAVIPARNEARCIADTIRSLLAQDYPGSFTIIVVDDDSTDGTAAVARRVGGGAGDRLTVLTGKPLAAGWTGKLWAVKQGIDAAEASQAPPDYLLLSDADILYARDAVRRLVAKAEAHSLVLTSLMVKLSCFSLAERALIPAFVYFFQMLYPFAWVNRADSKTAAAAGGCMLVRSAALQRAGGIERIRSALIDDCSLAKVMKTQGRIWLGLTERAHSIRPYPHLSDLRHMVARSAYAQLHYSPLLLAGTILGLALVFLAGPLLALTAHGAARWIGLATWLLMAISFQPMLRFYRVSWAWGIALPAIAAMYMLFTLDSALASARGRGGQWKGRVQATPSSLP